MCNIFIFIKFIHFRLFTAAVAISTFINLFLPACLAAQNYNGVICLRVLQGLAEGMLYPCCHGIWSKWAPPLERSRLATISFSGSYAGPVLGYAIGGILIDKYGAFGFLSPFYFFAILNVFWVIAFSLIAHDSPATHPTILQDERDYIERSIDEKSNYVPQSVRYSIAAVAAFTLKKIQF